MAYSGTLVAYGQGIGVVVATGEHTEIGRISALLEQVEEIATPLLRQMAQFGRWLSAGHRAGGWRHLRRRRVLARHTPGRHVHGGGGAGGGGDSRRACRRS